MAFFGAPQQQQQQTSAFGGFQQQPQQQQQQPGGFNAFGGQQSQAPAFGQTMGMGQAPGGAQFGGVGGAINWQEFTDALDVPVQCQLTDSVSQLKFSPSPAQYPPYAQIGFRMLAATTWDGTINIFQVQHQDNGVQPVPAQIQLQFQNKVECPILGICWQLDGVALLLACADNTIKKLDLATKQVSTIGQHTQPVKEVCTFIHQQSGQAVIISGGWDSRVKFWSWAQGGQTLNQVGEAYVAMPVHYMSCQWPLLVTAHQDRLIHIWNLPENFQSNNWNPKDITESPLKLATTSIAVFGDGKGYAVGSIEGRCGIKNYDPAKPQMGKDGDFCFKCHREEVKNATKADVYSVNCITFNTEYNTFATCGSDGTIIIWNKDTKSKYKSSKKFPCPFTASSFTEDGKLLAYAIGYDWSKGFQGRVGAQGQPIPSQIFVRSPKIDEEVFKRSSRR